MIDRIQELIERTKTDPDFKQRVRERQDRERDRMRPLWRKRTHAYNAREENQLKKAARAAVKQAIYDGRLNPANAQCAMRNDDGYIIKCSGRMESHHWHGYDEEHWLDIQWLCHHHHRIVDRTSYASH